MADYFEAGIYNLLDSNGVYHPMLAIKGDPGPVPSEEVLKPIVAAEIAKVVADAPEDFDTLKEISDWIATHQEDASAMNTAILQNTADILVNTNDIATLRTQVTEMISGTLTAGQTTLELTSDRITPNSIVDAYMWVADGTEIEPISYKTIKVENGKVTMTFDALENDLTVGIKVV